MGELIRTSTKSCSIVFLIASRSTSPVTESVGALAFIGGCCCREHQHANGRWRGGRLIANAQSGGAIKHTTPARGVAALTRPH